MARLEAQRDTVEKAPVLSAYGPLDFEGVRWAVMSELDEEELLARLVRIRRLVALTAVATAAVAGLALIFLQLRRPRA